MSVIGVIVLAAGGSTRMGRPKQLLVYRGESLLRRAVRAALEADCGPVLVVLGGAADRVRPELEGLPVTAVHNPLWEQGMGGSVRAGIEQLCRGTAAGAALLMLSDQPGVTWRTLRGLIDAYASGGVDIAASEYDGALGVPALFSAALFPELLQLQGAQGAKKVITAHADIVRAVSFPEGRFDIDTPEEYGRLVNEAASGE